MIVRTSQFFDKMFSPHRFDGKLPARLFARTRPMREPLARDSKSHSESTHAVGMDGIDVSPLALADPSAFIRTARLGLPGAIVKQAVGVLGHRELFVRLLGTTAGNLNRYYRRKSLGPAQSEAMLDTLRLVSQAASTFGDLERASEWLDIELPGLGGQRPIDLCDTFEGRGLVRNAIRRIEYGEFP